MLYLCTMILYFESGDKNYPLYVCIKQIGENDFIEISIMTSCDIVDLTYKIISRDGFNRAKQVLLESTESVFNHHLNRIKDIITEFG